VCVTTLRVFSFSAKARIICNVFADKNITLERDSQVDDLISPLQTVNGSYK